MSFSTADIVTAFALTALAGLATGIGSLIALLSSRTNTKFLSWSLGFSAGIMIYVSFMEMLPEAQHLLTTVHGQKSGLIYMLLSLFGGMALISLIDFAVPKSMNPHELKGVEEMASRSELKRTGVLVALSVSIHNFPEGIATFTSALDSLEVALPIAAAVAIHNIPEGVAVAVPIYHSTGNRKKAFWFSFLSGLAEPAGAVVAYLFLMQFWSQTLNGIVLSAVAGIMIFISIDELLPSAERYGNHHLSIVGMVLGMAVMALSLLFFV